MQSWKKFLYIPLLVWIILSLFLSAKTFIADTNSTLYTVYLIVSLSAFTTIPYCMLIYAPKHKYLATMSYMVIFWFLLTLISSKFSLAQISYSGVYVMIIWTTVAMLIYFFYQDKKFKLS